MWKKILLAFFVVLLAGASLAGGFLLFPERAYAVGGMALCLPAKAAGEAEAGAAAVSGAPAVALSVATSDIGLKILAERQLSSDKTKETLSLKECIYKPLVRIIAKTILHTMTQSIVRWINTGFKGSPSFVTDPQGFFTGVADQSFGRAIEDIAPMLCQPFRFQLQLGLGFQFSATSQDEVRCKLSDVITNIQGFYDSFVGGTFSAGGWESWINIAGVPQNNAYGAYLAAQGQIRAGIVDAQGRELNLLNWGKGFQSWRVCKRYEEISDPIRNSELEAQGEAPVARKGACLEYGPIKTPGAAIVDQTSGAFQSELRQLEVAQEIDEIFGALVSQLITRAFGGGSSGGLSGLAQADSAGVIYINTIPTSLDDPRFRNDIPKPHPNIDCSRNYIAGGTDTGGTREATPLLATLSDADKQIIYPPHGLISASPNRVNDILLVEARDEKYGFPTGLNEIARSNTNNRTDTSTPPKEIPYSGDPILKPTVQLKDTNGSTVVLKGNNTNGPTWEAYMTALGVACSREAANETAKIALRQGGAEGADKIISGGGAPGAISQRETPPPVVQTIQGNLASGKITYQSSSFDGTARSHSRNLVDGTLEGTNDYGGALTAGEQFPAWYLIDLEKVDDSRLGAISQSQTLTETRISKIKIYGLTGAWGPGHKSCCGTYRDGEFFNVYVTKDDPRENISSPPRQTHMGTYHLQSEGNKNDRLHKGMTHATGQYIGSITFNPPIEGHYVFLKKDPFRDDFFGLSEVQVIGTQKSTDAGGGGPAPEQPFRIEAIPSERPGGEITSGDLFHPALRPGAFITQTVIRFTANKDGDNIALQLRLCEEYAAADPSNPCGAGYKPVAISNRFTQLSAAVSAGTLRGTANFVTTECATELFCMSNPLPTRNSDINNVSNAIFFAENISLTPSQNRGSLTVTLSGRLSDWTNYRRYKFIIQALYQVPRANATPQEKTETSVINFTVGQ